MNLHSIQSRILNSKWMLNRNSLNDLYDYISEVGALRYGGLKGLLLGNPVSIKSTNTKPEDEDEDISNVGDLAIVNISGILTKGVDEEVAELLGLTSVDDISNELDDLAGDSTVSYVILAFNSPGGETTGILELGNKILNFPKPIYAWCETQCDSAAYWLASQSNGIGMTKSASIGNCGVYMILEDHSEKLTKEGIKINAISSGKYKLLGHDFRKLSDEERNILQEDVTKQHDLFKQVIKSNRPEVLDEALEGLSYEGELALQNNLCDMVCDDINQFVANL